MNFIKKSVDNFVDNFCKKTSERIGISCIFADVKISINQKDKTMDKKEVAKVVTNILRETETIGSSDSIIVADTDLLGSLLTKNVRDGYKVEVQISPTDDFVFIEYKDSKVVFAGYSKIKTFQKFSKYIVESLAEMLL